MQRRLSNSNKRLKNKPNMKQFICVNCGAGTEELFKEVSSSVMKIIKCEKCHNIADKYVEFEPLIILIDSVLLSKSVYRHILYNRDFKLHWKLSLVLLLLESFALWRQKLDQPIITDIKANYSGEKGFYICCLQNIIDNFILFILLYSLFILFYIFEINKKLTNITKSTAINFCKAIIIANFSKFFLLPIMIWKDNTTDFGISLYHFMLMGYYLLSLTQVCSVISNMNEIYSGLIVLTAFSLKRYFVNTFLSVIYDIYF